jgi:hypothetical protein
MVLLRVFGPWSPRCQVLETTGFLLGADVSRSPNTKREGQGIYFFVLTSLKTCLAWVALPSSRLRQA